MSRRVLFVAGEVSGDAQAARLAAAMLAIDPSLVLYGAGGAAMRSAGVDTTVDIAELSIMGFAELGGGLARAWRHYRRLRDHLRSSQRPDLVVLVDFPDFNLRLAKVAKRAGIKVFYYVSPQLWAWRRGRVRQVRRWVDRIVVLFPFEVDVYRAHGVDVHFVGHPLAADVRPERTWRDTRARYGLDAEARVVALLPGSRRREVETMLPLMLAAARELGTTARFALACAPGLDPSRMRELVVPSGLDVAIAVDDTYNLVGASDVALVTSGTATVECAILGCPMVVVYRMSPLSYAVARLLVRVRFIAMPNIILGRRVVPELVQADATAAAIAAELRRYLESPELRARTKEELAAVRERLVRPDAARRAAALALELLA